MKAEWQKFLARFDALSRRERIIVAAAVLLGGAWLGYTYLVGPSLARLAVAEQRIGVANAQLAGTAKQMVALRSRVRNPDAADRAALEQVEANLAELDAQLRGLEGSLVSPDQMQTFLESLLSKNQNLELLSLRTLPLAPLIGQVAKPGKGKPGKGKPGKGTVASAPNIYKHGVRIQIAGTYNDLLAYLTDLERMPQRIIWNRIVLSVKRYPRCVVTLTVYTLSLDKQWLVV